MRTTGTSNFGSLAKSLPSAGSMPRRNMSIEIAVHGPVTASPPAKTPEIGVARVKGSTWIRLRRLTARAASSPSHEGSCDWPIAAMIRSAGSTWSLSAITTGRRRPESS